MKYISTRAASPAVSGAEAVVNGIAPDGGLYVPEFFPSITAEEIEALAELSYPKRAARILAKFFSEFSEDELAEFTEKAYGKFDGDPCPVVKTEDGLYFLELTHGPTLAFKDMALELLPYLMVASKEKLKKEGKTLILVATSGDTGKAALEGFKDVPGTEVIVFYPDDGVSSMQKLQMTSQEGKNVHVGAIKGNFDDAQSAVKNIFGDAAAAEKLSAAGYSLSSANSINWGRLVPQIVYYISAYADLADSGEITVGEKVNFAVPTGNFGNILAGYYARRMGLPIDNLICASNANRILADFFDTGKYDTNRGFYKTMSPSMDILISSNLERLLFELFKRNGKAVASLMSELKANGEYEVKESVFKNLGLISGWADEEDTGAAMSGFFESNGYTLDPHTAVAVSVYSDYYDASGDETPTVVVSTASPFKFPQDVYEALSGFRVIDPFKAAGKLATFTGDEVPEAITGLKNARILHNTVIEKEDIKDAVFGFLGL
ncbi:MAG: threonine synthase [Clostridiaceae bacterium]|jgi:threonine synthase|nr:threonine synthase [Clostridiaceae bacterium]